MHQSNQQPEDSSHPVAPAHRGCRTRRGYILIVVLGLTLLVTSLGIAFLEANSTAMPEAFNRLHAARAQYLAESGIHIASHYLIVPPGDRSRPVSHGPATWAWPSTLHRIMPMSQ